jgi:hypothetical protein
MVVIKDFIIFINCSLSAGERLQANIWYGVEIADYRDV